MFFDIALDGNKSSDINLLAKKHVQLGMDSSLSGSICGYGPTLPA
jgi:hypothetical protein